MASSNSKRLKSSLTFGGDDGSKVDYISKLPNDILIDILNKLPIEEAWGTTFLSNRWKDLWMYRRNVELDHRWVQKTGKEVLPTILNILKAHNQDQTMDSIHVSFRYKIALLNDIQLLMTYASSRKVEELIIDFNEKNEIEESPFIFRYRRRYPTINIPECELHYSSIVKLGLKSLQLEKFPNGSFKQLKELNFERVKLGDETVENITSNCSSLTFLCLTNCNPISDLNVTIPENSNLNHLVIREELNEVSNMASLCIKVGKVLKSIEFGFSLPRKGYEIVVEGGDLVCSEAATFMLDQMHRSRQAIRVTSSGVQGRIVKSFWELLKKFKTVKFLTLSSWCIQVLGLETFMMRRPLNFEVQHLTLKTTLDIWDYRGVAYMILGSCKLENLVIVLGAKEKEKLNFSSMDTVTYNGHEIHFGNILQNLAILEFRNYNGFYQDWEDLKFEEESFFAKYDYGSLLVWNVKNFASNLQKMRFITTKKQFETNEFENLGNPAYFDRPGCQSLLDFYKNY